MPSRPIAPWLVAVFVLLAVIPSRAQESPDEQTRGEWRCTQRVAREVSAHAATTADCVLECTEAAKTDPLRFCGPFSFDSVTQLCLSRGRVRSEVRILKSCVAEDCPECYFGGSCEFFSSSVLFDTQFLTGQRLQPLLCDDASSPDGSTADEERCVKRVVDSGNRLQNQLRQCFRKCEGKRRKGRVDVDACNIGALDGNEADDGLQRCVDRARVRFLRSCLKCDDVPECWANSDPPLTCPRALALVEESWASQEPNVFCVDQPVCGDGRVSSDEECDPGAFPSTCGASEFCSDQCTCDELPVCGDGAITGFEFCDASAEPAGCSGDDTCFDCSFCAPDPCDAATPVGANGGVFFGTTSGVNTTNGSCGGGGPEDVYAWTPDRSGIAFVETCSSLFDTLLYVREGTCDDTTHQVACNDDACGLSSRVSFSVQTGKTYYVFVDGFGGSSGSYRLQITPPPSVYGSPQRAFLHGVTGLLD